MRTIELAGGHKVEMYDGVDEMPIVRYHKFTQLLVLGNGIGCDAEAMAGKIEEARQYLSAGDAHKAEIELLNLQQTLHFISNAIDPTSAAFACLVRSVDGELQDDITEAGLASLRGRLEKFLTKGERDSALEAVKKKLTRNSSSTSLA